MNETNISKIVKISQKNIKHNRAKAFKNFHNLKILKLLFFSPAPSFGQNVIHIYKPLIQYF